MTNRFSDTRIQHKLICLIHQYLLLVLFFYFICGASRAEFHQYDLSTSPSNTPLVASQGLIAPFNIAEVKSLRDFDAVFEAISRHYRITVFVEGVPLHSRLTDEQIASLSTTYTDRPMQPVVVIKTIADSFAYDAEQTDAHTFLLRKQYMDPDDLPCVTFDEIVHFLKEVDKIPGIFSPSGSPRKLFQEVHLVNSFSEEQLTQVHYGMPISQLPPDQRNMAIEVAGAMWMGTKTERLRQVLKELTLLNDDRTHFTWIKLGETHYFGYEGPFGPGGYIIPIPLNHGYVSMIGGSQSHEQADSDHDLTVPTTLDRALALGMLANRLPSTRTIAEFAQVRQPKFQTAPASSISQSSLSVNDSIRDKPFSLFGEAYATRRHLIRSLAALYGLTLLVPKEDDYTITLPQARPIQSGSDISVEVRRVTPLPIARFLSAHAPTVGSMLLRTGSGAGARQQSARGINVAATEMYYYPAVRRLLSLSLPLVPKPESSPVPVMKTNHETLRLIALLRLMGLPLGDINSLEQLDVPSIMDNPSTMYILVNKNKSTNSFSINFGPSPWMPGSGFASPLGEGITNPPKEDSSFMRQ